MKCNIVCHYVSAGVNGLMLAGGPARSSVQCMTHGMVDFAPFAAPDLLCPIGKIEEATEKALAQIAGATMTATESAQSQTSREPK